MLSDWMKTSRHNIVIKVKKLKEIKNSGWQNWCWRKYFFVYEDKYQRLSPKKSRLSSCHCKQQEHNLLESEAECLEKLGSSF